MGEAARKLYEEIRALPRQERRELLRLLSRDDIEETEAWMALSEPALEELWDNPYDAVYDALPSR